MDTINEGSSATYTCAVTDPDGVQVNKAMFTGIWLTLYDQITGNIINSRHDQDVFDANNVTIATDGTLTWEIQPEDTAIVNISKRGEWHIALFIFEWATGRHTHQVRMRIINYTHEPV